MAQAMAADAVIFGAVGGPKWDSVPYEARPEAGLLRLRKDLGLFANLRPAVCYPALADASSLKREAVEGLDIMPGSNARALEKARVLPADGIILDLEDSVAPDAKALARDQIAKAIATGGFGKREVLIRVNSLDTPWWVDDVGMETA